MATHKPMQISEAVSARVSTRAFLDTAVPDEVLTRIFDRAQQSPSGCNAQPWGVYVLSGEKKEALSKMLLADVLSRSAPNPDFTWDVTYHGIHRERQHGAARALYGSMGIAREDKGARVDAMLRNWNFFSAPHVAFLTMERYLHIMGAVDVGIYAQTLALLMMEEGISSCFQAALGQYPDPIRRMLNLPDEVGVLFGLSFGYADHGDAVNQARTDRVALDESVVFL